MSGQVDNCKKTQEATCVGDGQVDTNKPSWTNDPGVSTAKTSSAWRMWGESPSIRRRIVRLLFGFVLLVNALSFISFVSTPVQLVDTLTYKNVCAESEAMLGDIGQGMNRTLQFPTTTVFKIGKCPNKTLGWKAYNHYLKNAIVLSQPRNCTPILDVLAWVMDQANCKNETVMIAYGGLIHMLREGEFVSDDGEYIDDDLDLWVTPTSFQLLLRLEPIIFEKFGWSFRRAVNCEGNTVFGQLFPACEHKFNKAVKKLVGGFDIYPLVTLDEGKTYQDTWQGTVLSSSSVFPAKAFPFTSRAANSTLHLQVPAQTEKILSCIYGNWTIPSSQHAGTHVCIE